MFELFLSLHAIVHCLMNNIYSLLYVRTDILTCTSLWTVQACEIDILAKWTSLLISAKPPVENLASTNAILKLNCAYVHSTKTSLLLSLFQSLTCVRTQWQTTVTRSPLTAPALWTGHSLVNAKMVTENTWTLITCVKVSQGERWRQF